MDLKFKFYPRGHPYCPHYNVLLKAVCMYVSWYVNVYVCDYLYNLYQYMLNLQLNAVDLHEKSKRIDERKCAVCNFRKLRLVLFNNY